MGGEKKFFQSWKICVLDEKAFVRTSVSVLDEDGGGFLGGSTHIVPLGRLIAALALLAIGDEEAANVALLGGDKFAEQGKYDLQDNHLSAHHLAAISVANPKDSALGTVRFLRRHTARIKFNDDCNMIEESPFPTLSNNRTVDCIGELFSDHFAKFKVA
jgi:hypothetical protein